MSYAIRYTVWQRALDADCSWRAFDFMANKLGLLRSLARAALVFLSAGTLVTILQNADAETQAHCAIATAGFVALLETVLSERTVALYREAALFEAKVYFEWLSLWRRIESVSNDEVTELEARQTDAVGKYGGLTPGLLLMFFGRFGTRAQAANLNAMHHEESAEQSAPVLAPSSPAE